MIDLNNISTSTELPICMNSHLIGMKIKDVEHEFGVKVLHYHNPCIAPESREENPKPEKIIEFGMGIKVIGFHRNMDKLFTFAFE